MKLFIDSSDPSEIARAFELGIVSGVTTNPILMRKAGTSVDDSLDAILSVVEKRCADVTVSVQLMCDTAEEMYKEAVELLGYNPRVVVKAPITPMAFEAISRLGSRDRVNITAITSLGQAVLALRLKPKYISIFAGRIGDAGFPPWGVIQEIAGVAQSFPTQIIIGSIRSPLDAAAALANGADVVTASLPILLKMFESPITAKVLSDFEEAAKGLR